MATTPVDMSQMLQSGASGPPATGQGEERTPEAPQPPQPKDASGRPDPQITQKQKEHLLEVIRKYTQKWSPVLRRKRRQVLKAHEYLKNNQYVSFDPNTFMWYDPLELAFEGKDAEDLGIYRYVNNIYQMLYLSFIAALSPQVPKTRYLPNDADKVEDEATAKAGSTVQDIIERQNKIKRIQKMELGFLFTDGCYFKHNRFVVDSSMAGKRTEPVIDVQEIEIMPDRYSCPQCGHDTPAAAEAMLMSPACEECGAPLSDQNFFPAERGEAPVVTEYREVPNGMVKLSIFGALNITVSPYANELARSPMLRKDEEIDVGAIRTSYPDFWKDIKAQPPNTTGGDDADRLARQYVLNAVGGRNNMTMGVLPTLSHTWLQPVAFGELDEKADADELTKMFPKGVLVVHLGDQVLEVREDEMTERWTWCPTMDGKGMYPPAVGDAALEVQDQFNDLRNIWMEAMDRAASLQLFVNESVVSSKALNGKPNLPGTITGVKAKAGMAEGSALSNAFYQPKVEVNAQLFVGAEGLINFAYLVSGVMPQVFGGSQQDIETYSGQKQALNVAIARLSLFYENMREEHAESSERAVRCAAKNYTQDVMDVLGGGSEEFRNRYVSLDQLRGQFHAHVEVDQGFPQTYGEMRDRLMELLTTASKAGEAFLSILDEPTNAKIATNLLGFPGMVVPGEATRSKTLRVIDKLVQGVPSERIVETPGGAMTIYVPTLQPDPDFDDMKIVQRVIRHWANENYELSFDNPAGFENVRAYYRMAAEYEAMNSMKAAESAATTGKEPTSTETVV
jgi:hypothetical protein